MDFSLFKPTYTDRHTGQQRQAASHYIKFADHNGTRRRWPAFPDERHSVALGKRIGELVDCRITGDPLSEKLLKWLDSIPEELREKLAAADIIDTGSLAIREPLSVHLDGKKDADGKIILPGWRQHLTAGRTDRDEYAELLIGRVRRVFDALAIVFWRDLRADDAQTRIEAHIGQLRTGGQISGQTARYYVREIKSFCRWMHPKRATSPALQSLKAPSDGDSDKMETRPLSAEEMRLVIKAAATGKPWRQWSGPDRALLYQFAYESGIRPGQIRKLTVSNFNLDDDSPSVTAKAATVKRRKGPHTQALRLEMADVLKEHFAAKLPGAWRLPCPTSFYVQRCSGQTWRRHGRRGLRKRQRQKEIIDRQKSDFLADVDHEGRRAIFYSLRHTHGTGWETRTSSEGYCRQFAPHQNGDNRPVRQR